MQKYTWLNPVVEKIVEEEYNSVIEFIENKGYRIVYCSNQADKVQEDYLKHVLNTKNKPVLDARCPAVVELIKNKYPLANDNIAPIYPILISCAKELYDIYIKENEQNCTLTIVTPCSQLVDCGNIVFSNPRIEFITWNLFKKQIDYNKKNNKLSASPIPLGFFDSLNMKIEKVSGEAEIEDILDNIFLKKCSKEVELCELLFCKDGCHNGDGV
ncbi:hypothetical protein [Serpentinicella alkaliphila]|uniref:Iron only hydrogenase large subunit-like protein n=1 Tax=Serpentinicella alkaliphila TaxID=1734049 RepID=A0A4V2T4B6_9FIRM|nr:hypothetical protein [Serpentinicella alkaliphila]QUH24525.1 hypothetical protein HZR23_01075 [Serpentinicella alkaliphila]TCQ04614.1 hypothetical protein EDD79_100617 [Serpentinicella alkaliphila]